MGITIAQIQDAKLRELAAKVDGSFEGETKGNKVLDDCEMGIFTSQVKAAGLDAEYEEFLKIHKQTQTAGKVFDVSTAAAEKTRLEANVQKAKEKVANLREKLAEIENRPTAKRNDYSAKGGIIGGLTSGTVLGGLLAIGTRHDRISNFVCFGTLSGLVGAICGGLIGLGIYYLTRSKNASESDKKEYAQTQAALKAAEQELQQSKVELQHFMNNL